MTTAAHAEHLVVIPCAAAKLDRPAPAGKLYDSAQFRYMLDAATTEAIDNERVMGVTTRVMILSAAHGLVDLDTVLAPYDTKMGDAAAIGTEVVVDQLVALAPRAITAMLPAAYLARLWEAVTFINEEGSDEDPWIDLMDAFEAGFGSRFGSRFGIGFQRGVAASLVRTAGTIPPVAA